MFCVLPYIYMYKYTRTHIHKTLTGDSSVVGKRTVSGAKLHEFKS